MADAVLARDGTLKGLLRAFVLILSAGASLELRGFRPTHVWLLGAGCIGLGLARGLWLSRGAVPSCAAPAVPGTVEQRLRTRTADDWGADIAGCAVSGALVGQLGALGFSDEAIFALWSLIAGLALVDTLTLSRVLRWERRTGRRLVWVAGHGDEHALRTYGASAAARASRAA